MFGTPHGLREGENRELSAVAVARSYVAMVFPSTSTLYVSVGSQ